MTISRATWVVCDGCGDSPLNIACGPITTVREAREEAKAQGFVHLELEMIDLCRACAAKERKGK